MHLGAGSLHSLLLWQVNFDFPTSLYPVLHAYVITSPAWWLELLVSLPFKIVGAEWHLTTTKRDQGGAYIARGFFLMWICVIFSVGDFCWKFYVSSKGSLFMHKILMCKRGCMCTILSCSLDAEFFIAIQYTECLILSSYSRGKIHI